MFAFGGLLHQFRGGVPGAPVSVGMPVDRRAELASELAPVLDLLDPSQREAEAARSGAQMEAMRRRSNAGELAARLVGQALAAAAIEQRRATIGRLSVADAQRRSLLDAANAEAERIDRVAQERVPALVAELVARLLAPPS